MNGAKIKYGICIIVSLGLMGSLLGQEFKGAICGPLHLESGKESVLSLQNGENEEGHYQAQFQWPEARPDHPLLLKIPLLSAPYALSLNGIHIGGDSIGAEPRLFNVGPFLKNGTNLVELRSGISSPGLQTVLMSREKLYLRSCKVDMHPGKGSSQILRFKLEIISLHKRSAGSYSAILKLMDPEGRWVYEKRTSQGKIPAYGQQSQLEVDISLDSIQYWLPGKPMIYKAFIDLRENETGINEEVELPFFLQDYHLEDSLYISQGDSISISPPAEGLPTGQIFLLGEQGILGLPLSK